MKLGSQTGSVINHLLARGTIGQPDVKVGMGVTILGWTDRHPGTIFRVFKHRINKSLSVPAIEVRADNYKVVKGSCHDGSAEYEYSVNVSGSRHYFVFKDDAWREAYNQAAMSTGEIKLKLATKGNGHGLRIGSREEYYDPSF